MNYLGDWSLVLISTAERKIGEQTAKQRRASNHKVVHIAHTARTYHCTRAK